MIKFANASRLPRLQFAGILAGLLCVVAPAVAIDDSPKQPDPDLPKANQLFENAIKAIGGREALDGIKSSTVKAKMNTPMGSITIESFFVSPDRFLLKQSLPGMGEISMGSDGETTWVLNPMMGYQLIEPDDAEDMRSQASMHNLIVRLEKEFSQGTTVDRQKFHDQDCYKVRMVDKNGGEQFVFFNAETHLMAGMEMSQNSQMGPVKAVMRFEDWKERGDIKMFHKMIVNQGGMNMTMEMTEVDFGAVDKALFTLPAEVKRLAEQRKAENVNKDDASKERPSS